MFGLSFWEIAIVLVVALVVLGPKRLPQLARTLGNGLRSFRRASSDLRSAIEEPLREVRAPLDEMRADLYETVHNFEQEVEEAAKEDVEDADDADDLEPIEREETPRLLEPPEEPTVSSDDTVESDREPGPDLASNGSTPEEEHVEQGAEGDRGPAVEADDPKSRDG